MAWVQDSWAVVDCIVKNRWQRITVDQIANGGGTTAQRQFGITNTQTGTVILNGSFDLDISPDIAAFGHGLTSETTRWVWMVDAEVTDNLTGYISAQYQFNDPGGGLNKICDSTGVSCISISNISDSITTKRYGNNSNPNNNIKRATARISFDLDLNNVTIGGTYTGQLEVELFIGPDANGANSTDLNCI